MKIEEYLATLPRGLMSGDDVELGDESLRSLFRLSGLGRGDAFYHLGCGRSARSLEIAISEFGADAAVGVDADAKKIQSARSALDAGLAARCNLVCADIRDAEIVDATVILFWFTHDSGLIDVMMERFESLPEGVRILTMWGPPSDCLPDAVDFPYVVSRTPFRHTSDMREQVSAVFGTDCIDFVTAWEFAERYTKALGPPDTKNDRFLAIIETLIIWTSAWRLGVACGDEVPEPIDTYVKLMKINFDIDFGHLLER